MEEIKEKIESFKKEIKVGDVVTVGGGDITFICTKDNSNGDYTKCHLVAGDGSVYEDCNKFDCQKTGKSIAEIDYLTVQDMHVLPIEVKAGTQGGMKSLWIFMREKHLTEAVRCSLENFGSLEYIDKEDNNAVRHVRICPLYAISSLL